MGNVVSLMDETMKVNKYPTYENGNTLSADKERSGLYPSMAVITEYLGYSLHGETYQL